MEASSERPDATMTGNVVLLAFGAAGAQGLPVLAPTVSLLQGWLQHYNTRRRNHGDFMRGRTPYAVMEAHLS